MKLLVRHMIFGISVTVALLGAGLFTLGVFWLREELQYEDATEKSMVYTGAILISLGSLLALTTILPIYSVITRNHWLLNIAGFLNIILCLVSGDYGLVAFQLSSSSSYYIRDIKPELAAVFNKTGGAWVKFYDYLHPKLHCCGVEGPDDFQNIHNQTWPVSCCKGNTNCTQPSYTKGCAKQVEYYAKMSFIISGSISLAIALLNIITSTTIYVTKQGKVTFPD